MRPKATAMTSTAPKDASQVRVPVWIAVLAMAIFLAVWTFVFAQLIGDHVAAVTTARAAVSSHLTAL
jgi:hypothetical protein